MIARIAIPLPTSGDETYNRQNHGAYMEAVRQAGGEPVAVPFGLDERALESLAHSCQAYLLPGSPADVLPSSYGQPRDAASAPADPAREHIDRLLLEDCFLCRKPVLGICFGMQMLNVFCGGSLIQDLGVMPVNHSAGSAIAVAHTVRVSPGTLLSAVVDSLELVAWGAESRVPINSSHHQAVGIVGHSLTVTGRCPQDEVVEAIEAIRIQSDEPPHFVLGVQWHPERTVQTSGTSRSIFARLIAEAEAWAPGRVANLLERPVEWAR